MKLSRVLAIMSLAGCTASDPAAPLDPSSHGPPFLSAQPRWSVSAPPDSTGCFGAAVAVADLDGDGHRDLIVADPPCLVEFPPTAGRIGIYRGGGGGFADTAVWTSLDWQNPPRGGKQVTLATRDVDGDARADLLVAARGGAQVFAGIADLAAPLGAPAYRVPGTGSFGAATLADVDGDGRAEVVSVRAGTATVWRAAGTQLEAARAIAPAITVVAAGDTDGDLADDLVVTGPAGSDLYRGCTPAIATCDGGLEAAPAWSSAQPVIAMPPDLDGDGLAEALLGDPPLGPVGRVSLHLSDPLTGIASTPIWSTLADPNYPVLGRPVVFPGDVDGDREATEVVLAAAGRVYLFVPHANHLDELEPGFAWPRQDRIQDQLLAGEPAFGNSPLAIAAAGRVDGDKYADLVIGRPPEIGDTQPGQVYLFGGGKVPPAPIAGPGPYLPGEQVCALPTGTLPDLTVDAVSLARSLYVEHREFAPDSCELAEQCVGGPGVRKLLRFATSIANLGGAPAVIPGPESAPWLYHLDACHGHDHLQDFARYELLDAEGTTIAVGRKQGFFLLDNAPYCSDGPNRTDYFPDQGISPGWADVYVAALPCQWLDITGVPDGTYTLEVTADTLHLIAQDDVLPDTARVRVEIAGDRVILD